MFTGLRRVDRVVASAVGVFGVAAWAYTLVVLEPLMPGVSARAPMPGGDGELYEWMYELRWGLILLAVLAFLVAAADHWTGTTVGVLLGVVLVAADAALDWWDARPWAPVAGGLAVGAAVLAAVASRRRPSARGRSPRRRLIRLAVVAAFSAPQLLAQGTPTVNHPFLPSSLPVVMALACGGFGVLAAVAARRAAVRPLSTGWLLALLAPVVPLLGLGWGTGAGLTWLTGTGDTTDGRFILLSYALVAPMVALVLVSVHRHGPQRLRFWIPAAAGVLVLGVVAALPVLIVEAVGSLAPASALYFAAGHDYPADGSSVLPVAVLFAVAAAAVLTALTCRADRPAGATPAPPEPGRRRISFRV